MSSSVPTPHLMDDEGNHTQGESAASVTHGGLRRKGRLRSIVWEHFEKKKINRIDKAVCNYCKNALVARSSDGTKHLHDHLKTCQVKKEIEATEFPLAKKAAGEKGKTAVETHFDPDVTRRKMARAIVMHEYPLSIVEHQGLRDVMSSLNQLWKQVSRNTIKKEILDMYECERAKYLSVLEQTQGRIAITTDMWTAENQTKAYMAITAHFIDDAWALRSILLSFLEVPGSHTGQVLCDKLMGSLLEFNIERKLSSITVDNAATNDRMIDFMLLALDKNDLILGGQKLHVRCCAHILNLIVKDGLSVIGDLIENIRESVIFWSGSTKRKSTFDENAGKLGITSGRKLVQDFPTRWNSTYLMICSALHYKNVFCRLKNIDGQYKCLPSEHDCYPTSNLFLRHVCDIRFCLNEWVSTPRFKIRLVEYYFSMIYGDDATSRVQIVYGDCQSIVKEYKARYASAASSPGYSSSSLSTSHSMPSSGSYKGSTEWILGFTSFVNVGNEEVKDELDTYLGEKLVPFNVEEEFDVLAWWKVNGGNYPILSQIARDILAIPVTTVASESAFSTGGRFVSPYRNRLHPSTLEALMCSQSWIRALCGVVASTSPAYAKILDEELEIETDVEAIEFWDVIKEVLDVKISDELNLGQYLDMRKAHRLVPLWRSIKLSRTCGGNPDQTVDELLAGVVRSMSDSKNFPHRTPMKEFIISQGEFIYNQLIGLDETSKKNDQIFENLPVLLALLDETKKQGSLITLETSASSSLINTEENWQSTKHNKTQRRVASSSKFCCKINEDEIVDDYPLPAYYKPNEEENDEYLIFDAINPDELPRRMLYNWSLHNLDSRLISLELLPMKPCDDNDITIFGSGIMTTGDSSGLCVDANFDQSSSVAENVGGLPVYLSAIQEWMIEFGYSFISISVRTDISWYTSISIYYQEVWWWYRLGRPLKQYATWYKPVLKTARLAIALITMLDNQKVERYVVVHGHIILQQFAELPSKRISKCAFVSGLFEKMEERRHTRFKEAYSREVKVDEELDAEHGENSEEYPEDIKVEQMQVDKNMEKFCLSAKSVKPPCSSKATKWDGELIRKTCLNSNEVFLTNDCLEIELEDVKEVVAVEILLILWGHQHRNTNACKDKIVRERAEDRRIDQFPMEYYCKSLYWPERGAFFKLQKDTMGLGTGACHSCKIKETERKKDVFKLIIISEEKAYYSDIREVSCGGLFDGLQQAENEQSVGEAFNVNHPDALVFINNCNVILRAIMSACGDTDDCNSTPEAADLAAKLDEETIDASPYVHRNRSEHDGCLPGINPPTLKLEMKSWVVAWPSCLDSRTGEHVSPTVVDRVFSTQPLAGMALCFQQEIGLVDDVLADEQDIPAPAPPATRLLQDIPVRGTLLPDGMSKGKEKVIEVDDDELDFLPSLLTDLTFDPGIPLKPIRSSVGTSSRRMSPQTASLSGNSSEEGSFGSENTLNEDRGGDSGEVSSSGISRPEGRSTVGGRALSRDYAIDYITCMTTFDALTDLRLRYSIRGEIPLKIPRKKDTPSRPPRGYVTLFLESFKYGLRCPLQPYFAQILKGLNLAPGQLNPSGWRVLSGLFILWDRCCQSEPTIDEVKHLYQLKSSPKDAGWYYFQSSTKTRKPITDLPTGGVGNWKKKFFFTGGPWSQVAQIDRKDYRVPPHFVVPGSWGVHFLLKPNQLKQVEAVLANFCLSRELITAYNLLESCLVPPGHKMEDAVIGALTRKRPRPQTAKRDQNKDAPTAKRVNIVQQVPPLKTLPPLHSKVKETSGAAADPASSSPPVGPKSRLSNNRAEHLAPYLNELSKLVSKKDLEDFDGCTLGELVGAIQYSAFHLSCMTTYYKAKVGRYDRKMKEDIQSAMTRADDAEKKAGDLNLENLKLIEQESLAQAKTITLENELTKVKEDLQRQKIMYEAQRESFRDSHRVQHPDLKMDDLAAGVAQHMDEEAAKEDVEEVEPILVEEENSPPRAIPADVGEASTPRTQLVIPPAPEVVQPTDGARLTDPLSS
ncbi:hypothetical protein KPL70_013634 [Citrus sinensis]|nr:hypothetical protein KPL70_013634 [Citrus sinensis]